MITTGTVPVLVKAMVCAPLVVLIGCGLNTIAAGDTLTVEEPSSSRKPSLNCGRGNPNVEGRRARCRAIGGEHDVDSAACPRRKSGPANRTGGRLTESSGVRAAEGDARDDQRSPARVPDRHWLRGAGDVQGRTEGQAQRTQSEELGPVGLVTVTVPADVADRVVRRHCPMQVLG